MITLQDFINLYDPEMKGDFNIVLMTTVSVGNIKQNARLGSYTIKDRSCKELDMNTMLVEKFSITSSTHQGPSDTGMTIYVSDNHIMNFRGSTEPQKQDYSALRATSV